MEQDREFAALMARVQAGCTDSAQVVHDLYGPYLLRAVRRRLHQRLRSKFDSLDFVQDVWASFFAHVPKRYSFQRPEDLVAFLTTLARNKVAETVRTRLQRQKYNVNREQPIEGDRARVEEIRANVLTPSEIVMGEEAWHTLLASQPLVHRRILALVREGKAEETIADEVGVSQRTVRRVIQKNLPGARP